MTGKAFGILALCGVMVSGCGGMRSAMGMEKNSPDEFAVVRTQPLVMPPDFSLRPPRPGEKRPEDLSTQAQAISALFPGRTSLPGYSAGERGLLEKAGALDADSAVRSNMADSSSPVADKGLFLREILAAPEDVDIEGTKVERVDSEPLEAP